ncbi:peptidoglycan-binding domain-containing protein [Streptomyces sp. NBC_01304]|uniref:peptidoglycan-binding domain-containing protein n=1 Tax=Streptomyces sp. NBC_01304 TaxID=2903818 RepID=UPI002E0D3E13|nr:peptidoglycan-binding protein [Streptomyces sp. NBC_01304]
MLNRRKIFTAVAAATMVAGLSAGTAAAATPTAGPQGPAYTAARSCAYYTGTTLTDRGDKGLRVKEVQCLLLSWGFNVGPDGVDGDFGPNTEGAVRQFQGWYGGLSVDGQVGVNTWRALRS